MIDEDQMFRQLIDSLIEFSEFDPELADGIKWLDHEARRCNVSFYEMVFSVLNNQSADERAKKWLDDRNT